MAANKFATMLFRNTNKMTLILIYAVLEWTLIILLLLNSLFSYLIIKFADYFGLKTPCLWCSRVDHIFDSLKTNNSNRDLLCEAHAKEISTLGYCSNHQKLAESQSMCENCSSSQPDYDRTSNNLALLPWVKEVGIIQSEGEKEIENRETGLSCSCCRVKLVSKIHSPCLVIKPSLGVLDSTHEENLISEVGDDDQIEELKNPDRIRPDFLVSVSNSELRNLEGDEDGKEGLVLEAEQVVSIKEDKTNLITEDPFSGETIVSQVCAKQDESIEILPQHLEFFVDHDGYRLIAVELTDSTMAENQSKYSVKGDDESCDNHDANLECDLVREVCEDVEPQTNFIDVFDGEETLAAEETEERVSDVPAGEGTEEAFLVPINEAEAEAEVSIGTEIPDLEPTDEFQDQELLPPYICINKDPSTSSPNFVEDDHALGSKKAEEESLELKTVLVEVRENVINNQTSLGSELNETEEERVPDTPTSMESLHHLHKKLLLFDKKESGTEESLDGSVISEFEGGGEGVTSIEHLKLALRAERKALNALYTELEEERSASAVAANQTMAMINRLQEEKAAMQMEALQYQRMMEEQSEYDQEALQLLNELMVKREKEKEELEREVEVYRKKVLEYEAREKMRVVRRSKDGSARSESSFAASSNGGDTDGLSIDLNQEAREEDGFDQEKGNHDTPVDAVLNFQESLANFEEERLSILDQLKVLEEKLFTLDDGAEKEQNFDDIKSIEHFYAENGKHVDANSDFGLQEQEVNGVGNGCPKQMNGKHNQEGKIIGAKGKKLLPLFKAIDAENEISVENGHENGFDSNFLETSSVNRIELENKNPAIEDEVDQLYERLQALEADREFLKHCIISLKKGEKGMQLLQEILQHLRDLRTVELRARNLSDIGALI
ncbi:hypothetical protein U1Q18_002072 [Sarracenia purpurea var. burkii]